MAHMSLGAHMLAHRLSVLAASVVAISAATAAQAQDISYTYVEATYVLDNFSANNLTLQNAGNPGALLDDEGSGYNLRASVALPEIIPFAGVYVAGDYYRSDLDLGLALSGDATALTLPSEVEEWRASLGFSFTVNDQISVFAEAGYAQSELSLDAAAAAQNITSRSDGGFDARIGVRLMPTDSLELYGFGRYHPSGDLVRDVVTGDTGQSLDRLAFDAAESFTAGLRYNIFGPINLVGDYEFGSVSRARFGVRLAF